MNATALFLEPAGRLETRELQPLPEAGEAAWDRWMVEVGGAGFLSWRVARRQPTPTPSLDGQLHVCLADE
jgi:hypothetical protein